MEERVVSGTNVWRPEDRLFRMGLLVSLLLGLTFTAGCWAPFCSRGIPACQLPDNYRYPSRTAGPPLNFASLSIGPQDDYILGPDDILEITLHGLYPGTEVRPIRAQVMASGKIHLPLVGAVHVGGMNLMEAHMTINEAYADGFIKEPRTNIYLVQKATTNVLVLGEVNEPGMYSLSKYENDVAHALAAAGGLGYDAAMEIEVHRRTGSPAQIENAVFEPRFRDPPNATLEILTAPTPAEEPPMPQPRPTAVQAMSYQESTARPGMEIVRIPLRGFGADKVDPNSIVLRHGDVVVVPSRKDEVFYVVGKLSPTNFIRFSISERERDIGAGFLLPVDREIDVVMAVAMAGYIDPIDSPTTVTVHRTCPDGRPMLILVDLIKARYDRRETVLIQAGDIVYLNPDAAWWGRRTFDRIIPSLFSISYRKALGLND